MIVRLTTAQLNACRAVAHPLHVAWLEEATPAGKASWDVPMPPIGWRQILDRLSAEAFTIYGQRKSRVSGSFHRAVKRVAGSLAHLEAHPAFNGAALPGEHDAIFLAWWAPEGGYTPYPVLDSKGSWAMEPEWLTVGGIRVTRWRASLPLVRDADDLLDPSVHYAFIDVPPARGGATTR